MPKEQFIRESDTAEWKARVQQEALHRGTAVTVSPAVETGAPAGYDLDDATKLRAMSEARQDTKLGQG